MKPKQKPARDLSHSFTGKIHNWQFCRHCGLITLKNEATIRAMRAPCPSKEE